MNNTISAPNSNTQPFALTERHLDRLLRSTITPNIANLPFVCLYAVDDHEGARLMGQERELKFGRSFSGIAITYHTADGRVREYRLRRDHPDIVIKDGREKEEAKYLTPGGRGNMAYFPLLVHPDTFCKWLNDTTIPIVFCEGEFKALCLMRIALSVMTGDKPPFIVIGLAGVWNFRGRIGKTADGREEKDIIHDIYSIPMKGRKVTIFYDSNIRWNQNVRGGRRNFAYALRDTFEAQVFFAEMPEDAEADGLNGPDDLAFARGDQAVVDCIEQALPAFRPIQPKRETTEERMKRGAFLRAKVAEAQNAPDVQDLAKKSLGAKAFKRLAYLWAQAGKLGAEERDLLFVLHSMSDGEDDFSFYYADLYPLLYYCNGTEIIDGKLSSGARQRIRRRFDQLIEAQEACGIKFIDFWHGYKGDDEGNIPSRVRLLSAEYAQEIEDIATIDPHYGRGKQAAFERATAKWVELKTGNPYKRQHRPPKNVFKQIEDGWKRTAGNIKATVQRMQDEGYEVWAIAQDLAKVLRDSLPAELVASEEFRQILQADLFGESSEMIPNYLSTKVSEESAPLPIPEPASEDTFTSDEPLADAGTAAENPQIRGIKIDTSKSPQVFAGSRDNSADFEKRAKNPQPTPSPPATVSPPPVTRPANGRTAYFKPNSTVDGHSLDWMFEDYSESEESRFVRPHRGD